MSAGDLDIRSGGVVAVDTASLRAAADRLAATAEELDVVGGVFRRAVSSIESVPRAETVRALARAQYARDRAARLADETRRIASRLVELAAVFETVELRAERLAAEAARDWAAVERIDARLVVLEREHPKAVLQASWEELARTATWAGSLVGEGSSLAQWLFPGGAAAGGLLLWGFTAGLRTVGAGTVGRGARLTGPAQPVVVREIAAAGGRRPPATLAAAAQRIPSTDGGRVRVERYAMPDGSRQYAVYVRGTTGGGAREAFDMTSNLQLYGGEQAASYEAAVAALHDAGAGPGDVVHAFGHSQGAMVAARLAVDGDFDTRTLVTFGAPVDAEVGEGTLSVAVRHRDDPVVALAGGGYDGGVGSPGSFVAERTIDPMLSAADADPLTAHHMTTYRETAAMLDSSGDPRMATVRERLAQLGAAASVEVREYAVERADPEPDAPSCR
ncbi:hypothetical protein [Microbacterium sp. BK668]|uniref:hypothetical protein n=1 Tax=Microbacterium sp. BK668 TaxID=2512118 RepID=UPI00105CD58A|nr:hypothetical protein [Microbacterium sp. BK668]TDN91102.1 hypothetical protein EV279_0600 [Microbacterium sp. BK668]